jgi:hypothetical protein
MCDATHASSTSASSVNMSVLFPQALPVLQAVIPLRRANMRLRLQVAPAAEQDLELLLRQQHASIESQEAAPSQAGFGTCYTRYQASSCEATPPAMT